jgi:hypothetical protein
MKKQQPSVSMKCDPSPTGAHHWYIDAAHEEHPGWGHCLHCHISKQFGLVWDGEMLIDGSRKGNLTFKPPKSESTPTRSDI